MAKFECLGTPDLVVSTASGFIQFKDRCYSTTNKKEIESLRSAKDVKEIKVTPKPKKATETEKKDSLTLG